MENNPTGSIFNLELDEESKSNLSTIALWANINAIIGIAGIIISVLSSIIGFSKVSRFGGSSSFMSGSITSVFIGLAISLLLNITLLHAAINIKKGVQLSNQQYFVTGLTKLATYFRIFGIIMIVVIVIVLLAVMLGGLLGGFSRGF